MRAIDCRHLGHERVICCWQVGDVLIDPGPTSCLDTLLAALGDRRPRALLLTHIHLDHAGASGTLARRWPELEIYVHERGARHMADPARLLESAGRLYGEEMDRLWGPVEAVPRDRLQVLQGGEHLQIGSEEFDVAYTPGHASHHVSYLHGSGTAFVGDTGGVRIVAEGPVIPPTPPPDIDLEAWGTSLATIREWSPERLAFTHFGDTAEVGAQLDDLERRLRLWAEVARDGDLAAYERAAREELESVSSPEVLEAYQQAVPFDQSYAGLRRYWEKRAS